MYVHLMKGINFVQATIEAGLIPPLINILQKVSVGGSRRYGGVNLYVCTVRPRIYCICTEPLGFPSATLEVADLLVHT